MKYFQLSKENMHSWVLNYFDKYFFYIKFFLISLNCWYRFTILANERVVVEYETALVVMPSELIVYFHQCTVFMSSIGKEESALIRSLIRTPVTVSHCGVTFNKSVFRMYVFYLCRLFLLLLHDNCRDLTAR